MNNSPLSSAKVFVFDVDGTLALGPRVFDCSRPLFDYLRAGGKRVYIATNNSSKTPDTVREKLSSLGEFNVLSSLTVALDHLKSIGHTSIYLCANSSVTEYVQSQGFTLTEQSPDALLLTYDTEITYAKLCVITRLLHEGVPYYATHTDFVCPTELGYPLPDIGCLIDTLRTSSGRVPLKTFGKPSPEILDYVLKAERVGYNDIAMVGDRLYTDILLAVNTKCKGVLVLSGETTREMHGGCEYKADYIFADIGEMLQALKRGE